MLHSTLSALMLKMDTVSRPDDSQLLPRQVVQSPAFLQWKNWDEGRFRGQFNLPAQLIVLV
jgi:hypothetical protein